MSSFNLTVLLFELKRQLSAVKQKKELYMDKSRPSFSSDVKKELLRLEQTTEALTLQIQLLEE